MDENNEVVVEDKKEHEAVVKTFSQDDVNRMIGEAKKTGMTKVLKDLGIDSIESAKDGLTKFREWQESQKSESEKINSKLTEYEKELIEKNKQVEELNAKFTALNKGVNIDKVDKVIKLISAYEGDQLEDKIDAILTEFPDYKKNNVPSFVGGQTASQSTNQLDNAKMELQKIMGLKRG
jgi:hypothetical protein